MEKKRNIPEGFSLKKMHTPAGLFPLLLFECLCFPSGISLSAIPFLVLPFTRPQTVGAKAASQRSDSSATVARSVCNGVCSCQILLCSRGSLQSNSTTQLLAPNYLSLSSLPDPFGGRPFLISVSKKAERVVSQVC